MRKIIAAILVSTLPFPAFAAAAEPTAEVDGAQVADEKAAIPVETAQPSERSIPFRGGKLAYTVTPGTLLLRDNDGNPIASMFYVAYTVDRPKDAPPRPVTFLFNGGPGSASMYLHMGSFGPLKMDMSKVGVAQPGPNPLLPNPETMLDKTDLVFLDAITTGFSRPVGDASNEDFWGVDQDIDAFARGIQRYLTLYDRWQSPKFLIGESYGTMRAGGLVRVLQDRGMQTKGVVVISTVFRYSPAMDPGTDQLYVSYLPSYAVTAAYHNRLSSDVPSDVGQLADEAREFANGPYLLALQKGNDLSKAERNQMAEQLSRFTGLSAQFVLDNNLRVEPTRFRKELLRDQRRTIGRLDARFTAIDADAGGATPEFDAAGFAFSGAFISAVNDYLLRDLEYETDLIYRPSSGSMIGDKWDFTHRIPGFGRINVAATTMPDLALSIRRDPHLKVLDLNGYYDLATPFGGAEYDLKRIILDDERKDNILYRYYPSGHMIYVEPSSARQIKEDLDDFYDDIVNNLEM